VTPQLALYKSPGLFSAVQIWRGQVDPRAALRLAGEDVLVAFKAEVVPFLPMARGDARFPSTQADLLVQVAGDDRQALLDRVRQCKAVLAPVCDLDEELLGGKIGDGREPFGFRDGIKAPTKADIDQKAICKDGSSFVLYQRYEQSLERFAALRELEQLRVFGITKDGRDLEHPPEDAHVQRARKWAAIIRRGFPYRASGAEGLAFVAASNDLKMFERGLETMLTEPLLRWAEALSGGVYRAPPL
jgi:Dyp-type peroxidase family